MRFEKVMLVIAVCCIAVGLSICSFTAGYYFSGQAIKKEIRTYEITIPRYLDDEKQIMLIKEMIEIAKLSDNEQVTIQIRELLQSRRIRIKNQK